MELVDTHSHLEELAEPGAVLEKAKEAGVIAVVAVGSDYESNRKVLELAGRYAGFIFPALGLHPQNLGSEVEAALRQIEENIDGAVAIGEVGLDYHKRTLAGTAKERQKAVLKEVLGIALKSKKPAILHSRYAWQDCYALVSEAGLERAVFHWFTGPTSVLRQILDSGYMISATPAAEYHQEHRRAVKAAPADQLLLETDSPVSYGGPGARWQAEPADTVRSLRAAAGVRGVSPEDLARTTTENAVRFFRLGLVGKGGGNGRQAV